MKHAKYVGRVGALAVALGIGAAVATTPGVAWADGETDKSPVSDGPPAAGNPEPDGSSTQTAKPDPGAAIRRGIERAADDLRDDVRKAVAGVTRSSGGAITSKRRSAPGPTEGNVGPVILDDKPEAPPVEQRSSGPVLNNGSPNESPSFTPRWRAPQSEVTDKPVTNPVVRTVDDVKDVVQQSVDTVTGMRSATGSTAVERSAVSTLDAPPSVEDAPEVRPGSVAPVAIITNVLNAAIAPFLNPTPGQPAPQNPILWAVLGWVRRQVQESPFGKVVLNRTPRIDQETTQPIDNGDGTFTITAVASDPDGDNLHYTAVSRDGEGTITPLGGGKFLYDPTGTADWDGDDAVTLTVTDEAAYPHLHGLSSFFGTGAGHTATYTVAIDREDSQTLPEPEVIEDWHETTPGSGVYEVKFSYDQATVSDVRAAANPTYWKVVHEQYVDGVYTVTLEPTDAGRLRAALGMPTDDKLNLQVSQGAAMRTMAFRSAAVSTLAAEDPPEQAYTLPAPPPAVLHVEDRNLDPQHDPWSVVVTNDYAYIMSSDSPGKVSVIDSNPEDDDTNNPTYNTVVKTIDVGDDSVFGTLAGDNLYVLSVGNHKIAVIDTNPDSPAVNTVINEIDVPNGSTMPHATPDGKRVYVTNQITGDITVIDSDPESPTYNTVVGTVIDVAPPSGLPVGNTYDRSVTPGFAAFNEDGTRLYVSRDTYHAVFKVDENGDPDFTQVDTVDFGGDVVVIDTDPTSATYNQVIDTISIDTGQSPGSIASNGNRLYVNTYDYEAFLSEQGHYTGATPASAILVLDVDPQSATFEQFIDVNPDTPELDGLPTGALPYNVAVSPDGSLAYIVNLLDGTVTVVDTATNEQIGDPVVYDVSPQTFEAGGVYANVLALSPDGKQIYITKYQHGTVTAISIDNAVNV